MPNMAGEPARLLRRYGHHLRQSMSKRAIYRTILRNRRVSRQPTRSRPLGPFNTQAISSPRKGHGRTTTRPDAYSTSARLEPATLPAVVVTLPLRRSIGPGRLSCGHAGRIDGAHQSRVRCERVCDHTTWIIRCSVQSGSLALLWAVGNPPPGPAAVAGDFRPLHGVSWALES